MYQGKQSSGTEFFSLLFESDSFTSELGKVALASSKLEAEIILLLKQKGIKEKLNKATLGKLIEIAEKEKLLDKNLTIVLKEISKQRNYLTHNIYSLFIDLIDETILERTNLLDSDVHTYEEKAWQLKENLLDLANIIEQKNKNYT
jgi:hypothetical protein